METKMKREDFPAPEDGFVVTHFLTVEDIQRSVKFYSEVLGGEVLMDSGLGMVKLANSWIIVNVGGGPTDDKPDVYLSPPKEPNQVQQFLNLRVANIQEKYEEWSAKGAEFLTEPIDRGAEIRCYMRDPDGYLIEVGQATGIVESLG
jgi:predicted enzyme related to lactoylglutathione lyase